MTETGFREAEIAEFVIGVMPRSERESFSGRLTSDPELTKAVQDWEERLAPLQADYEAHPVPRRVKIAIDNRLFRNTPPLAAWASRPSVWFGALASGLAVTILAVGIHLSPDTPNLIARLDAVEPGYSFQANFREGDASLTVLALEGDRPDNRDFELWAIVDGVAPVSLGVLPASGLVQLPTGFDITEGLTLAVSLELPGGSPTGAPTGPVLSAGVLRDA